VWIPISCEIVANRARIRQGKGRKSAERKGRLHLLTHYGLGWRILLVPSESLILSSLAAIILFTTLWLSSLVRNFHNSNPVKSYQNYTW